MCFDWVAHEFTGCPEAWAGVGEARLMMYLDRLKAEELADREVGLVLTGAFEPLPGAWEVVGKNARLWKDAVAALEEALRQKPGWPRVQELLGVAHLFHPEGKDCREAIRRLDAAARDDTADLAIRSARLVNLGVALLAGGEERLGLWAFDSAEALQRKRGGGPSPTLAAALRYNRGMQLTAAKDRASRERGVRLLEQFLRGFAPGSPWWAVALKRYRTICRQLGQEAVTREQLTASVPIRTARIRLPSGGEISLGEKLSAVIERLGPAKDSVIVAGSALKRHCFERHRIDVIGANEAVAVCLVAEDTQPLTLLVKDGPAIQLRVGMTERELSAALGTDYRPCESPEPALEYRYYPAHGVAVRLEKGKVVEVVLSQPVGRVAACP
jgi:hypothetical protein